MTNPLAQKVHQRYQQLFSTTPYLFRSPGRINILGEHTDYNDGFVLPGAIDKEAVFAIDLNKQDKYQLTSLDLDAQYVANNCAPCDQAWANYLLGVVAQIEKLGQKVPGFNLVFGSNIPIGAGVSSSAAIECGLLFALNQLLDLGLSRTTMAQMAQSAEHEYAGVKCGIMDQYAVLHGKANQVLRLDCRALTHTFHTLNLNGHALVLCDTGVKHSLAESAYNQRREECVQGVRALQHKCGNTIHALRDANLAQLHSIKANLSCEEYNRCTYVIEENARVNQACQALKKNQLTTLGQLMYATHEGLSALYKVSCQELDQLVDIAHTVEGVLGARMMGGGFGGCTLNIVQKDAIPSFTEAVTQQYYAPNNLAPNIIVTQLSNGTSGL